MLEVVRVLCRNGPPEGFGDDDGGRVFNPRRNRAENMSDPLAVGAALLGSDSLKQSAAITEEAIWMFGERAVESAAAGSAPDAVLSAVVCGVHRRRAVRDGERRRRSGADAD